MVCGFGAFKEHVTLTFFRGDVMTDPKRLFNQGDTNVHNRSIKITHIDQVDEKILMSYVKAAGSVNVRGIPLSRKAVVVPPDLVKALAHNKRAKAFFDRSTFTCRKEYAAWITGAKKEETRVRRVRQAVQRLAEGKKFN